MDLIKTNYATYLNAWYFIWSSLESCKSQTAITVTTDSICAEENAYTRKTEFYFHFKIRIVLSTKEVSTEKVEELHGNLKGVRFAHIVFYIGYPKRSLLATSAKQFQRILRDFPWWSPKESLKRIHLRIFSEQIVQRIFLKILMKCSIRQVSWDVP